MCLYFFVANSQVGLDDFVEMTKKYAQGIAPSPVMAGAGGDNDEDDDDDIVVKNPDELPLHQKVGCSGLLLLCCCFFSLGLLKFTVFVELRTSGNVNMSEYMFGTVEFIFQFSFCHT